LSPLANCQGTKVKTADYSLSGTIKGITHGWLYVKHRQTGKIDSAVIENGTFIVKGKTETPEFCNIGLGDSGKKDFYFGFFLAASNMTLTANKDSLFDAAINIEGYIVQDEFKEFQKLMRPVDVLSNELWEKKETSGSQDSLDSKLKELDQKRKAIIWDYAIKNSNSYITAFEASSYFTEKEDLQKLKSIFNKMCPAIQKWYYAQKIKKHLQENNILVRLASCR
jgi:hypothetical protein